MIHRTKNRRLVRQLGAINSAEHYLIARTRREFHTAQADSGQVQGAFPIMLAISATCMSLTFALVQVWPHIAVSIST